MWCTLFSMLMYWKPNPPQQLHICRTCFCRFCQYSCIFQQLLDVQAERRCQWRTNRQPASAQQRIDWWMFEESIRFSRHLTVLCWKTTTRMMNPNERLWFPLWYYAWLHMNLCMFILFVWAYCLMCMMNTFLSWKDRKMYIYLVDFREQPEETIISMHFEFIHERSVKFLLNSTLI